MVTPDRRAARPRLNLADVWEAVADAVPAAPALVHADRSQGDLERTWSEFDDRSARLAAVLGAHAVGHDDKVALYLYNGPEYVESTFGCWKARAVPVNVNYRYTDHELRHLLDDSDAVAVVVDGSFVDTLARVLPDLPAVRLVLVVGDDHDPAIDRAGAAVAVAPYEDAIASATPAARIERSPEDLWFLYTGGTTGRPKGVMWPLGALYGTALPTFKGFGEPLPERAEDAAAAARRIHAEHEPIRLMPAAPLMHGTSAIAGWGALSAAGALVTLSSRRLDAAELLRAVERHRVTNLTIVGDAFAKPIVAELEAAEARGEPYDLSSLRMIVSSGVMWSQATKDALLARADILCADLLGSSEGTGFARSVATRSRRAPTARFRLGPDAAVFTPEGTAVAPGSGERGVLAVGGPIPIGYYKDPDKTAETFRTFDGRVWSVPGDWATVEADGTITLLGRGSVCINTAGEKVFPEEVEEALKTHPAVRDANVVGVPDPKWGQAVSAVVAFERGATATSDELVAHCRTTLAGYKCPKSIVVTDEIRRGPNGKADYRWAASVAAGGRS